MRVAYLTSQYPALSHTFIRREVAALRQRGIELHTFSVRPCPSAQLKSDADRQEAAQTHALLPSSPTKLARAHLRQLFRRPRAYLSTLKLALRRRSHGLKAPLWALFHFVEAGLLADELERRGIEHLHCHFANAGSQVAALGVHLLGLTWSLTLHGSACFNSEFRRHLGDKVASAQAVFCVSDFGRAQAQLVTSPEHWSKIRRARCGLDLEIFADALAEKRERHQAAPASTPASAPASNGPLRLLSVGRLVPEKGQVDLLEAFAGLASDIPKLELRLVGEGPLRPALERKIAELGLGDRCTLLGACSEAQVVEEMRDADVFVMSSLMEGLPVVLMESLAVETPVVAPRLAGIPELVEEGVTGLLFTPARADQLAAQLRRLLTDKKLRRDLAQKGRRRVEDEFDIQRAVEPLFNFFKATSPEDASR